MKYKVHKKLITEAPLPDSWDSNKINTLNTSKKINFKTIIDSILQRAKKLGAGTSRIAFEINEPGYENTVIKVAKNAKGLAQNELEADICSQSYYDHLVPKLIDEDKDSVTYEKNDKPLWIQVEKATKASPTAVKKYLGIKDINSLSNYFIRNVNNHRNRITLRIDDEDLEVLNENERIQDMMSLMNDYDLVPRDLGRVANLGFIDGELVFIDLGANSDIIASHYRKK